MERLQKVIAMSGYASRRAAEKLIIDGVVTINGQICKELGTKVSKKDIIVVNGEQLFKEQLCYYILNKPSGYISSNSDDVGRKVVTELLGDVQERIFPVGRLDFNTTGIILLTNDGEFSNLMMHPKHKIKKTYIAHIDGILSASELRTLKNGVVLQTGYETAKCSVRVVNVNRLHSNSTIQITISEGKYHQVKLMLEAVGKTVTSLQRTQYGSLTLKGLPIGCFRELSNQEIKHLKHIADFGEKRWE